MLRVGPKEWSPSAMIAIKVNAFRDVNGNPCRGWMITSCRKGEMIDFVDEGYQGSSILRKEYPGAVEGPELRVTPGEYRDLKKKSKKKPELGKGERMAKVKGKVPPVLMAWVACRKASGVKPGVKMTAKQKAEARTCVARQLRKK